MSVSCITTPTATRTDVSTSESLSTTTTVSTTTLPGDVTSSTFRTCVSATATNVSTCVFTDATTTFTLPGNTTLVTVPVTVPIDIPITNIVTLFGSFCTTSPIDTPPVTSPTDTSTTNTSTTTPLTTPTSTLTSTTTSPPLTYPTDTTTTSDPSSTQTNSPVDGGNHTKKSNNAGPIAGGVIGGIAALLFLGFLTWKLIKKQRRFDFDDIFNADKSSGNTPHYKKRIPETKPYDYGILGQQGTHPTGLTPPSSPPPTQSTFGGQQASAPYGQQAAPPGSQLSGHAGAGQGMGNMGAGQGVGNGGLGQGVGQGGPGLSGQGVGTSTGHAPMANPVQHLRSPSLTPLLVGIAAGATAGAANAAIASSSSSRPSTSSSVGPQVYPATPVGSMPAAPSAGSTSSGSMYPPALQSWAAAQSSAAAAGQGAGSSSLAHNMSAGSSSSMYTNATGSGTSAPYNLGNVQPMVPVVVGGSSGTARHNHATHQQAAPQQLEQYADPFARSGSPVSVQEQRILQVTNADPSEFSPLFAPIGPSRQSYSNNSYFPHNQGAAAASSSSSSGANPSRSSSSAAVVPVDGKGRPLNLQGEKVPLVHLDGGLYQEPAPDAEPAPPSYTD